MRAWEPSASGTALTSSVIAVEPHHSRTEFCAVPGGIEVKQDDLVVFRDEEGEDLGRVLGPAEDDEPQGVVVRHAAEEDLVRRQELDEKTKRVLLLFRRLKDEFKLKMKVVDAHWRLDRRKICFYFVSDERLDFRALHKVISSALSVRVAIKQIGVRDHARVTGGLGPCGRELCCRSFLKEMRPVALRMARQQNLFVEPAKISGVCGKLLCCLHFEEDVYRRGMAELPRIGSRVETPRGQGRVVGINVLTRKVTVRYDDEVELSLTLGELEGNATDKKET